jgi:4-amino-4-deoxy-L-arabinose transferase-like glycosyltransferase
MIAWVLIIVLWLALLSLILHDVTKDEPGGSAVIVAAKAFAAFLSWAAQKLWAASRKTISLLRDISSSSKPIRQDTPGTTPAPPSKPTWWRKDRRAPISATELELKIAEAARAVPGCEGFIGVIVQPKTPKSRLDPNWEIRGVKFGNADRRITNERLATVVARLEQEFRLAEHHERDPPRTAR